MSRGVESSAKEIDWLTVLLYLGLVLTGWLMIYAVGVEENPNPFDLAARHGNQVTWVGVSIVIGAILLIIDGRFYQQAAYIFFGIAMFTLLFTLVGGKEIAGSKSWLIIGPMRIQPAEPAKFTTCLALAAFLSSFNLSLQRFQNQIIALAIILLPMCLVVLQGDAGSALVYASLLIVLFREGMPAQLYVFGITMIVLTILSLVFNIYNILIGLILIAGSVITIQGQRSNRPFIGFIIIAAAMIYIASEGFMMYAAIGLGLVFIAWWTRRIMLTKRRSNLIVFLVGTMVLGLYATVVNYGFNEFLQSHQKDRINVWLKPSEADPLGSLYNVNQSKKAIGSGGLTGKGFLQGEMTKMEYVPEQVTDFIFCTIGEEHGFIGAFAIILLFTSLLMRIIVIAERQRSRFTRVYAYGVASILFFHLLINIGMTIGLMPVIGIPLPFISYGGSSLLSFTMLLAILVRLDAEKLV
jgi:rod shape determining protein RodA